VPHVLTCRQAVYETMRHQVPPAFREYFPLGFDEDDIHAYASQSGLDPSAFSAELERAELWLEASVPFVLSTLVEVFRTHKKLERTRAENLSLVVEELLGKRTRFGVPRQRRALQLLGLAMELYSRNELTVGEATRVLSEYLMISAEEAATLVDELTQTILLRTVSEIRFQVRSFGEYFAARQLENAQLSQILAYAQFRGSLVLNPTWANTISYLVEMNPRARGYFVRRHPVWSCRHQHLRYRRCSATKRRARL